MNKKDKYAVSYDSSKAANYPFLFNGNQKSPFFVIWEYDNDNTNSNYLPGKST